VWSTEKKRGDRGRERQGRGQREGAGRAQTAKASSAGWRLRQRAEVGGGRRGAAATQRSESPPGEKTQGVAWLLVSAVVTVSVACCFSRLAAWLFLRVPCRGKV